MFFPRAAAVVGVALAFTPIQSFGQQPAPVVPSIPAPGLGHHALPPLHVIAQPPTEKKEEAVKELNLGECIAIAVERQPSLQAVRASQGATAAGQRALNNIGRVGRLLSPDLPIRKQQADRGVIAAAADVQKLHNEVVHDVTLLYYSVVYARQQAQLASDVAAQMEAFVKIARDLLNSATPGDMNKLKFNMMILGQTKILSLQAKANAGVKKAEAALREAMGVADGSIEFRIKDKELPLMALKIPLADQQVVDMALARRPELALAAAAADAFRLEVYAQGQLRFRRAVPTLASGGDIHSRLLPTANRDPGHNYRPEPIAPEMPPQVVGSKQDRVARTLAYSQRADAVYAKARDLMILEARKTFIDFEEARDRVLAKKEGYAAAREEMKLVQEQFDNPKSPKDTLLIAYAQAAEGMAEYVEAVYLYLQALAALERVTAGGVKPAFPGR